LKELELISLRNLIPLIARITNFNELTKFIEEKMMPLFQFEHYALIANIDSDTKFIGLQSFTQKAVRCTDKAFQQDVVSFLKSNSTHNKAPVSFVLKVPSGHSKAQPDFLDKAYNSNMREALLMSSAQNNASSYWLLFGSKKGFFNPFKQELFETLQVLVGMALERCMTPTETNNANTSTKAVEETPIVLDINEATLIKTDPIIGDGAEMQVVKNLIMQSAPTDSTVLILGETGTGKELIAKAIHQNSNRSSQIMITINCAALPPSLIESELFGHEKGSFTGATDRKLGKFELAHNSTIFLDEIGELPLGLQAKLLRVLQERVIERIGGQKSIAVNVRIIAATNRNLQEEIVAGRFRSDLYYRLNVFPILLPALRDRPYDLKALTHFFIEKFSKKFDRPISEISQQVWHSLHQYAWPGNVRELEHTIERSLLMNQGKALKQIHFVSQTSSVTPGIKNEKCTLTLKEAEREYILKAIHQCNGRISGKQGAAMLLGVPATTLFSKMEKLGIKKTLLSSETTTY
jgi:transcriptional regulator with GAF, ATPase, and Fis domain